MKKLRWRLFLHFSLQFLSIAALMVIVIFLTLLIGIGIYAEDVSQSNYYQAKLEAISVNTGFSFSEFKMNKDWDKDLEKEQIWVQIIDHEGTVIESGNVPDEIPNKYTYQEMKKMKETKQLKGFSLAFYLETFYDEPYLFVLGYQDQAHLLLKQIVEEYGEIGTIAEADQGEVENLLKKQQGALKIYRTDGSLQQMIGLQNRKDEKPLDVFVRDVAPDIYSSKRTTYEDTKNGLVWELYTPNETNNEVKLETYLDVARGFLITGAIVLLITIAISIWNGFRYGNPLFIFANWLGRMGNENYSEVLTEREKKKVYRKNGKIRLRFKLYQEVFEAFHNMAGKLEASRKEREQLEKNRSEWMTGISHDLRTPLSTMQGYGNLLESGQYDWTTDELEEIGKTIREKSDYMLHLIEDFSLSFQLKNGGNQVQLETVEVSELFEDILGKYERDRIINDYPISFVPLHNNSYLNVNRRLFERMLDNLIYNAMKHNPPGTNVDVILEEINDEGEIKIVVKDNGIGMDEATKKHLFDRYYRGTNTDERVEGTGLGMSIAMQIAKLHSGEINVESWENIGTEITVTLLGHRDRSRVPQQD
ncbi:sensor histidine kinase [Fredinandcohnia onubensis]|uniref:sensor histidine kinase n=1 Tax=Fredinandcohnia onubensis TaxID=1571209 RepID=UPI000C0BE917|nr:HAMP domain-containing sensor histidine kinase [Fredinandcohnia onubensis]